jgi:hypothetical protein
MSYFTDPLAAIEEAEFLAKRQNRKIHVVETEPNRIELLTAKQVEKTSGVLLEVVSPTNPACSKPFYDAFDLCLVCNKEKAAHDLGD